MNRFQAGMSGVTNGAAHQARQSDQPDATVKAASAVSEQVLHRDLDAQEKRVAGPMVHYIFGSTMGALYGAFAELFPGAARGSGVPFATAVWVGADEIAVPALGLAKPATQQDSSKHTSAFASHVVYGFTADFVRRAVRAVI